MNKTENMYKKHIEKRRNIDKVCRRKRKAEQDYLHMKNKKTMENM